MRGKEYVLTLFQIFLRITPAYAGKSTLATAVADLPRDHPRLCGEKVTFGRGVPAVEGSPPPMRGKAPFFPQNTHRTGITPAYAGKRVLETRHDFTEKDHPRLCGEKFRIHLFITCQPGSPPPMRGKDDIRETSVPFDRITPAYAGKSGQQLC